MCGTEEPKVGGVKSKGRIAAALLNALARGFLALLVAYLFHTDCAGSGTITHDDQLPHVSVRRPDERDLFTI